MQLNPTEMRVLEDVTTVAQEPMYGFQLPTIHPCIPLSVEVFDRDVDYTTFARALVDAGVVTPAMLSDAVRTPRCIVEEGLRAWFYKRTCKLKFLRFDVGVFDPVTAADIHSGYEEQAPDYKGWVFALFGYQDDEVRIAEPIAVEVEKKCPGLFYAAFSEMESAGYQTVEIRTPQRVIEQTACYSLWEGDLSEMPSDEEAMEYLVDRYEKDFERYLPSVLMQVWGEGFCFSLKPKKPISARKLKALSKSDDLQVASIANQLLRLRKAQRYVEKCGADMPSLDTVQGQALHTACSIGFNRDDRYTTWIDDELNGLHQEGDYTEYLAVDELPTDPNEIKTYFFKLDALFRLMAELDALIPLLSQGDNAN